MAHEVRGVVATAAKAPVTVETVTVPDPGPGEALVRVLACGVCHTDLHYREGGINDDFPFLLGHEAAGDVEAVGEGVEGVAPRVIFWDALAESKPNHGRPRRQARHWPQTARQFRITKSPGARPVTSGPTASTTPAASCPSR